MLSLFLIKLTLPEAQSLSGSVAIAQDHRAHRAVCRKTEFRTYDRPPVSNPVFGVPRVPGGLEPGFCRVGRRYSLPNPALLHRRKICRTHVRRVHFLHRLVGLLRFEHFLKLRVGHHRVPVLLRFLAAGMRHHKDERVVPSGGILGYPVTHNLQIVLASSFESVSRNRDSSAGSLPGTA